MMIALATATILLATTILLLVDARHRRLPIWPEILAALLIAAGFAVAYAGVITTQTRRGENTWLATGWSVGLLAVAMLSYAVSMRLRQRNGRHRRQS